MPGPPKAILLRPENRFCADCLAAEPRWASVNIGIFLCEVCAGIHRKLGTHVSQVRSVSLDEWRPEWVQMVDRVGNARAKAFYEHNVPQEERFGGRVSLQGGDRIQRLEGEKLEQWVRAKYQELRYAPPGGAEPRLAAASMESSPVVSTAVPWVETPWPTGTTSSPSPAGTSPWGPSAQPSWPHPETSPATISSVWPASVPAVVQSQTFTTWPGVQTTSSSQSSASPSAWPPMPPTTWSSINWPTGALLSAAQSPTTQWSHFQPPTASFSRQDSGHGQVHPGQGQLVQIVGPDSPTGSSCFGCFGPQPNVRWQLCNFTGRRAPEYRRLLSQTSTTF